MIKIDENKLAKLSTTNKMLDEKYGVQVPTHVTSLMSSLWPGSMEICSKSVVYS